jgi:hypothetical protein
VIYLLFSSYSTGSTFVQNALSNYIDIPLSDGRAIGETEFSLLDWGAFFVFAPHETIDFEPCRTHNPNTGQSVSHWRNNYRDFLSQSAESIGRNYWDSTTQDWYTVEKYYLEVLIPRLADKHRLPTFDKNIHATRLDYVTNVFEALANSGPIFAKNPKWLNDFSGLTMRLFDSIIQAGTPIKGIFLYRCPADTFTSILERKFRLDEMFKGDMTEYEHFVFDSVKFSTNLGINLTKRYNFFQLRYEEIDQQFPDLLRFVNLGGSQNNIAYRKKYNKRHVLHPRSRARLNDLKILGYTLGYPKSHYPQKITILSYLWALFVTVIRTSRRHKENVNNPETAKSILKKCFWYEASTPKAIPLKKLYRFFFKKKISL